MIERELLEIEEELAGGSGAEYERRLAEDAVVIVPGRALGKNETVSAMNESPGWEEFRIAGARVIEPRPGIAVLTYRFDGRRGNAHTYAALMSSIYSSANGEWRLLLHQQTLID